MTILFKEDWDKYPTAIPDLKTKNESFLRLARMYKSMGVDNHAWPLALVNQDLQGLDARSPDLTYDEKWAVTIECQQNFWYFVREVVAVPGTQGGLFIANRGIIAAYWTFLAGVTPMLIMPRQTGKSFGIDVLSASLLNFVYSPESSMALLTKDDTLRRKSMRRLKDTIENLPEFLNMKKKSDPANSEQIYISDRKTEYTAVLSSTNPKAADKAGRGITVNTLHVDEGPFVPNIAIALAAALPATLAAGRNSEKLGEPYGVIYTTTAGKKDDVDGKFMYDMLQDSAVWSEKFFDTKNKDDFKEVVRKASRGKVARINMTFSHRQLGFTDEWLIQTVRDLNLTGEDVDRDMLNMWTSGSNLSPFTPAQTEMIRKSEMRDHYVEIVDPYNYTVRWFIPEEQIEFFLKSRNTVVGADTSNAGGGDDIGLVFMDVETGGVIGSCNIQETNLIHFSMFFANLLVKYPMMTAIIEAKSTGPMIMDYIFEVLLTVGENPWRRLFNLAMQDPDSNRSLYDAIMKNDRDTWREALVTKKRLFGFATSGGSGMTSRSNLYGANLLQAVKTCGMVMRDPVLITQTLSLVKRNDRIDHPVGGHDDLVIAWALSYWMLSSGRNLDKYGIDKRKVLSANQSFQMRDGTPEERALAAKNRKFRALAEELMEDMAQTKDRFIQSRLEARLRSVLSEITEVDVVNTANDFLEKLNEDKRNKRPTIARRGSGSMMGKYSRG